MKDSDHNNKSNKSKAKSGLFGAVFSIKVYLPVFDDVIADVKFMDKARVTVPPVCQVGRGVIWVRLFAAAVTVLNYQRAEMN